MQDNGIMINVNSKEAESISRENFIDLFKNCPIPSNEILQNLGLFINRQSLSRILFMDELYKKIINVHGIVVEFGVRWGQNLSLFESFRGMYEPFNYNRRIVGFDTFEGFTSLDEKDGESDITVEGAYSVTEGYEKYLTKILNYHERESPISHIKKYELVKGDATVSLIDYLNRNPETIIAFAYFDFDIYKPTKICLEAIKPHLTKGSVIGFDELNCHTFQGETLALKEVFGLHNISLKRSPLNPLQSYFIFE
ncbi:crotonobetainyl-CoA--carnitine CoA-transferase [Clostridium tagluense]|uniref:crotonobetainyl-CoA--carnitine CoA-transferase n=1 Tax=Clostridium tagluense TaxID=360422 RepID=UPI001CF10AB7|nr:crotonobetainyl-CoA--carnitine CoA-transferase [Clostridium tagluense]MCB2310027.1 crotonobetainyl-CoA--carnitine CoA-transferase [Clostridium tagluense]MCB2314443.1 crotonobetainyl-CoA--carnitine CoA-transferase [Clostridium tagluense]MCB2319289.1 crotonobetainyl-CoA--carnitine CoA-transferase [Clostridium tagluense]MCB2324621.1 crotonobetainyl-CoA--carnitine CoA-transferase [Clostridium tagluense]MCB2329472.1 crotonobetainyl-CoA--carnitine CoA-transferase [Clostridium tagluense]